MNTTEEVQNIAHFRKVSQDLVQKLVQIRKSIPMTQASMAEWLGVDRRKIIDLENGKMNVSLMLCYAEKLSVDIKLKFEVN
jgi:DNA-binding XRE family transcriptional regulator